MKVNTLLDTPYVTCQALEMIPTPLCDKCGHTVADFHIEYLPVAHSVRMVAVCHGERDTIVLTAREFMNLKNGIVDARAFRQSDSTPRVTMRNELREAKNDE